MNSSEDTWGYRVNTVTGDVHREIKVPAHTSEFDVKQRLHRDKVDYFALKRIVSAKLKRRDR